MPEISVLIPVYNVQKYLKQCMDSIINQTLKDIEIICINDGSNDNSLDILKQYASKDNRIKIIDKENTGYGNSMNIGLNTAGGQYIAIVEPDDFIDPKMYEDLYKIAKENDSDIVKSEFFCYTTQNNQSRKSGSLARFKTNKCIDIFKNPHLLRVQPSIWSAIYKKDFLISNNINFLETPGAAYQDVSFSFKTLCLAKKISLTTKAFYYYRTDNETSSVNSKDKTFLICGEFDEIDSFLNKNPDIKNAVNAQKLIKQYGAYMWNLNRIGDNFKNDFINKFSKTFKQYYENNEIEKEFYKKINKKDFLMLINSAKDFIEYFKKQQIKNEKRRNRRKMFSIRINSSRISIVLFGKQIVGIG